MPKQGAPPKNYSDLYRKLTEQSLKPRPKTDDELIDRINEYWDFCDSHEYSANWQSLVAYCGLTLQEARDIANGQAAGIIVGGQAATILQKAGEICTAVDVLKAADGTHKSPNFLIFEKKQPNPGAGYVNDPQITLVTPDALLGLNGKHDIKQIKEKYRDYLPADKKKVIDVEAVEEPKDVK